MAANVQNRLSELRRARGIAAAELAGRVGVSRQTIYAIEAGTYVPNTEVTLRLARELAVSVEDLFSLAAAPVSAETLQAEVLGVAGNANGAAVQVARVGERVIGVPVSAAPYFLPEADGMLASAVRGRAKLTVFSQSENFAKRLVLAGCDPAIGLLAAMVERNTGVVVIPAPASSRQALDWLRDGKVHIAGTHLKDARTGEFNLPILAREYPHEDFVVVTFAAWEEGFVVARGNPKSIKSAADLARRGVRFVNRESGSGSRALLDGMLREAGVAREKVGGYGRVAYGHLAAAHAVSVNESDCCIATQSAARTFGLDFVALQSERYDFVLQRSSMEMPEVRHFFEVLQRADLRRKLEVLAGYETARTGAMIS